MALTLSLSLAPLVALGQGPHRVQSGWGLRCRARVLGGGPQVHSLGVPQRDRHHVPLGVSGAPHHPMRGGHGEGGEEGGSHIGKRPFTQSQRLLGSGGTRPSAARRRGLSEARAEESRTTPTLCRHADRCVPVTPASRPCRLRGCPGECEHRAGSGSEWQPPPGRKRSRRKEGSHQADQEWHSSRGLSRALGRGSCMARSVRGPPQEPRGAESASGGAGWLLTRKGSRRGRHGCRQSAPLTHRPQWWLQESTPGAMCPQGWSPGADLG